MTKKKTVYMIELPPQEPVLFRHATRNQFKITSMSYRSLYVLGNTLDDVEPLDTVPDVVVDFICCCERAEERKTSGRR